MKINTIFLFICLGLGAHAQMHSTININFVSTQVLNIEKRRFFEQEKNYSLEDQTPDQFFRQLHRGNTLPTTENFNVKKIDENNYRLTLVTKLPEMVYINYQPVYITPGDSVNLKFNELLRSPETRKDTIIAEGKYQCNYEFSNFLKSENLDRSLPIISIQKYRNNMLLFCADLKTFYTKYNLYYQSVYLPKACNPDLIDYIQRKKNGRLILDLIAYENDLRSENRISDAKVLGNAIEENFSKLKIVEADSISFEMEILFKFYFKRLTNVKYHHLAAKEDFMACKNFIRDYQNLFIRQYFIYFFITNYSDKIGKYDPETFVNFKKDITIPQMLNQLKELNL